MIANVAFDNYWQIAYKVHKQAKICLHHWHMYSKREVYILASNSKTEPMAKRKKKKKKTQVLLPLEEINLYMSFPSAAETFVLITR